MVAALAEAPASPVTVVMVATAEQLTAVVDAALEGDVEHQLWIVMSTVGPDAVRRDGARLESAGAWLVDAPVTGGVTGARAARLRIFAAGHEDDLTAARSVLEALGTPATVGASLGAGQAVKVINQLLCSVHLVAAAEAVALAEGLGLDAAAVLDLVGAGAGASWMLGDRGSRMLAEPEEVSSTVGIFVKDSGLVASAAESVGIDLPVLIAARDRFALAAERGWGSADDSQVVQTYR
ncbi:NAD(P)-dependent oxidoreductase [Arenivirga flava]|uniref:Beta-hydroxyacid dehydrogenase n=1 Tax=Arenivirga flava TaxID=1930060 RepID=A0AA37UK85_9MICO|nr:NAD-binding protein [Arenivirga flava]GMA28280.1 beta-hydroxyacid dehydrogenase [Arenivirga flava]